MHDVNIAWITEFHAIFAKVHLHSERKHKSVQQRRKQKVILKT